MFLVGMTYANCSQLTAEKNKTTRCDEVRLSLLDSVTKTEWDLETVSASQNMV